MTLEVSGLGTFAKGSVFWRKRDFYNKGYLFVRAIGQVCLKQMKAYYA